MSHGAEIGYGPLRLGFVCDPGIARQVRDQLEPFFTFESTDPGASKFATLNVRLEPVSDFLLSGEGKIIDVDTSLYKRLASSGLRWGDDERFVIRIDLTDSHLRFDRTRSVIELWQPYPELAILDTVRTVKSLFTPALERVGCVQLHSAGVVDGQGGILILGDMWQGKTTLLLEFLAGFDVAQLSCDTVVAWERRDGGVTARGWPSPFSMSHGTMSDHPELYTHFPKEQRQVPYDQRWLERKKTVLTSAEVVRLFRTSLVAGTPQVHVVLLISP